MTQSGKRCRRRPTLDVTVILPVYNEAGHLRAEVDRIQAALEASPYSYEIIVVDDGSTDGSGELPTSRRSTGIRLIHFPQNRGSGSARKAGTHAARGRVTVWTDVDMTYPNDTIPQLVKELDGYDQVVGARTTEEGTHQGAARPGEVVHPQARELPRRATKIPDLNSGFRAFRTDVARQYLHPAPAGLLVRHHDHDDVPRERLLGEVRADRVREARRDDRSSTGARTRAATPRRSCA